MSSFLNILKDLALELVEQQKQDQEFQGFVLNSRSLLPKKVTGGTRSVQM